MSWNTLVLLIVEWIASVPHYKCSDHNILSLGKPFSYTQLRKKANNNPGSDGYKMDKWILFLYLITNWKDLRLKW